MIRVLHVDDDPGYRDLVADLLERASDDLTVSSVGDPEAGLAHLASSSVDCVVSDYQMPGMTGVEFLRAVRAERPELPFILLTGKAEGTIVEAALAAGVTDVVTKEGGTHQFALLARRIEAAVSHRRAESRVGHYERLLDRDPVAVLVLDETATIEWVNGAVRAALGTPVGSLEGRPLRTLADGGPLSAGFIERYHDAVDELRGRAADSDAVRLEAEVHPPASPGPREYEGLLVRRPTENGDHAGAIAAFRDVTERNRRRRELEEYEAAMETVPDGVILLDETGTMTRVNRAWARTVGAEPAALNGEPFLRLVEEGIVDRGVIDTYLDLVQELLAADGDRERARFLTRVVPPNDDREHVYEVHIGLLPHDGSFQGAAGVVRDITEKVDRQRALEAENERLEAFATMLSHDLRNPLMVLKASLEEAERTGDPTHFTRADEAIDRMDQLIADVLTLARPQEEIGAVEAVDLGGLSETCWETIDTKRTTLRVDTERTIRADPGHLRQLLENLLTNAVQHAGETSTITVGDLEDGRGFYVADDGPGVPTQVGDRVFESGYSTGAEGTGIGLSIVRRVADAHDWRIALRESDSGGARFEFHTDGSANWLGAEGRIVRGP